MSSPETTSVESPVEIGRRHDILGILFAAGTVLTACALWSYDARGGENWIGPVGEGLASVLVSAFGLAAWLVPTELGFLTRRMFRRQTSPFGVTSVASTTVVVLIGCAMVHLLLDGRQVFGGHLAGGVLGEVLGEVLRSLVGHAGSYVTGAAILLITLVLRTDFSVIDAYRSLLVRFAEMRDGVHEWAAEVARAWHEARELDRLEQEAEDERNAPRIMDTEATLPPVDATGPQPESQVAERVTLDVEDDWVEPVEAEPAEAIAAVEPEPPKTKKAKRRKAAPKIAKSAAEPMPEPVAPKVVAPPPLPSAPTIVPPSEPAPAAKATSLVPTSSDFQLPPTSLLDAPPPQPIELDAATLRANAALLTEKLQAYGVKGRVDEIHPGPVVTMYEFEPESGTKISKIAGLADDLALALAAQKVRIVAPIPGKARVGFELPNDNRQTVYIRDILEDERWPKLKAGLPVAFGKDITGQPVYGDLAKMPHLLVAGATGSGKSVGLNVMLASLLARRTPEEVRLLMIDPKVVELAVFDGIPHMLLPVVTDMKKAALALRWAVDEMERRYQLFADAGARNLVSYNKRVAKVQAGELAPDALRKGRRQKNLDDVEPPKVEQLPYIVVVVDEFADLMMVAAKDVESAIARLAQKARAAGLHVILATQRPSVDVITGMIKANFPSRVAFKVSQREDSKVILGRSGAEHLLGLGDMLMLPPGASDLARVHSAYISEDEVRVLCDHLREQGRPKYDESILEPREDDGGFGGAKTDDPIYDKAVACVAQAGYCSISHIQRQLSVGYNKAAKLVERMEQEGVVGPPSGKAGGRREVLINAH